MSVGYIGNQNLSLQSEGNTLS